MDSDSPRAPSRGLHKGEATSGKAVAKVVAVRTMVVTVAVLAVGLAPVVYIAGLLQMPFHVVVVTIAGLVIGVAGRIESGSIESIAS